MNPLKRMAMFAVGVLVLVGLSAPATPAQNSTAAVSIKDFAFKAATITVPVGTTVVWTNDDSVTHTVTSRNGAFDSGNLRGGNSFEFTFTQAGSYNYFCSIHPSMTGKVVVTAAQSMAGSDTDAQEFSLIHSLRDAKIYPGTITVKKDIPVRLFNAAVDGSHNPVVISSDETGNQPVFGVAGFEVEAGKLTVVEFTPDRTGEFFITHKRHGHDIVGKLIVQ